MVLPCTTQRRNHQVLHRVLLHIQLQFYKHSTNEKDFISTLSNTVSYNQHMVPLDQYNTCGLFHPLHLRASLYATLPNPPGSTASQGNPTPTRVIRVPRTHGLHRADTDFSRATLRITSGAINTYQHKTQCNPNLYTETTFTNSRTLHRHDRFLQ